MLLNTRKIRCFRWSSHKIILSSKTSVISGGTSVHCRNTPLSDFLQNFFRCFSGELLVVLCTRINITLNYSVKRRNSQKTHLCSRFRLRRLPCNLQWTVIRHDLVLKIVPLKENNNNACQTASSIVAPVSIRHWLRLRDAAETWRRYFSAIKRLCAKQELLPTAFMDVRTTNFWAEFEV